LISSPQPILEVDRINTFYGEAHILHDVHLMVDDAQSVALLGRNGAGKTTTLRSILGLTPARRGVITFKGRDITHLSTDVIANLGIGWVPDNRRIFPTLTVQQNLFIAEKKGSAKHPEWNLERIYSHFPKLKEVAKSKGENLSGGEQQMLAIARALMGSPVLLLLDEPTEGLAPLIVEEMMRIIQELGSANIAILLVEQNALLALRICSQVYVLDDGRTVFDGSSQDLMENHELKQQLLGI
jgi:branched-chain amino acid transport system ATP-binding protein